MQMHAELQVLSPLVPIREVLFLRFCKQHAEGLWAVVDVSVDAILRPDGGNHHSHHHHAQNGGGAAGYMGCRLLPTGCIVQDMNNGYSKVRTPARPLPWLCSTAVRFDCRHKSARRSGMWRLQCASSAPTRARRGRASESASE